MTHLSLFTGVGGFDLGFDLAGCAAVSELVRRDLVDIAWTYENGDLGLRGRR